MSDQLIIPELLKIQQSETILLYHIICLLYVIHSDPVVQRADSTIQWKDLYSGDKC